MGTIGRLLRRCAVIILVFPDGCCACPVAIRAVCGIVEIALELLDGFGNHIELAPVQQSGVRQRARSEPTACLAPLIQHGVKLGERVSNLKRIPDLPAVPSLLRAFFIGIVVPLCIMEDAFTVDS